MKFEIYTILSFYLFLTAISAETFMEVSEIGPYVENVNTGNGQYQTRYHKYSSKSVNSGSPIHSNGYNFNMGLENNHPQNYEINYIGSSNQNHNMQNIMEEHMRNQAMQIQREHDQYMINQLANNNNYDYNRNMRVPIPISVENRVNNNLQNYGNTDYDENRRVQFNSVRNHFLNNPYLNPTNLETTYDFDSTQRNNNDQQSYHHIQNYGGNIRNLEFDENGKTPLAPFREPYLNNPTKPYMAPTLNFNSARRNNNNEKSYNPNQNYDGNVVRNLEIDENGITPLAPFRDPYLNNLDFNPTKPYMAPTLNFNSARRNNNNEQSYNPIQNYGGNVEFAESTKTPLAPFRDPVLNNTISNPTKLNLAPTLNFNSARRNNNDEQSHNPIQNNGVNIRNPEFNENRNTSVTASSTNRHFPNNIFFNLSEADRKKIRSYDITERSIVPPPLINANITKTPPRNAI